MALKRSRDHHDDKVDAEHQEYDHEPARKYSREKPTSSLLHSRTDAYTRKVYAEDGHLLESIQSTDNDNLTDTDV